MDLNKAKEQAEDLIVQLRELIVSLRKCTPSKERDAQKEQLKVIGNSILHLENKGVPVPEDLIKLKDKLDIEIQDAEKHQLLLYFLKEQLVNVLSDLGVTVRKGAQAETV
jgi:hypothetical protein